MFESPPRTLDFQMRRPYTPEAMFAELFGRYQKSDQKEQVMSTTAEAKKPKPASSLKTGSLRNRLFRALQRFPDLGGLTLSEIRQKTGLSAGNGRPWTILQEEIKAKRVRVGVNTKDIPGRFVYSLTQKGLKDLADGKVE